MPRIISVSKDTLKPATLHTRIQVMSRKLEQVATIVVRMVAQMRVNCGSLQRHEGVRELH
eukprot:5923294-Amphidinium_carterae.1